MPGCEKRFPNAGQAVLLMIGSLMLQLVFGAIAALVALFWLGPDEIGALVLNPWLLAAGNTLAIYLAIKVGLRATRESIPQFCAVPPFSPASLGPIVITSLGLALVLNATDNLFLDLLRRLPGLATPNLLNLADYPLGGFALVVVVAPLTEEYLFRGLILRGLLTRLRPWTAILISAALFAFMHANLRQLFLAFVLGMVFGWWFWRARSVGPGLIGHALFNSMAYAAAQWPDLFAPLGINAGGHPLVHEPWWLTTGGIALGLLGIWWFQLRFRQATPSEERETRPAEPPFVIAAEPPLLTAGAAHAPAEPPTQPPAASPAS